MKIIDVEFEEINENPTSHNEHKKVTHRLDKINDTLLFVSVILGEIVLAIYAKNIFTYLTYGE